MAGEKALVWDEVGKRTYTTGIDHVALYVQKDGKYPKGVAWNGFTGITENPSGADENAIYADNIKYLSLRAAEEFGLTLECLDTPVEFDECDGCATPEGANGLTVTQQTRRPFGLVYRNNLGSDTDGDSAGYELHLVYGCSASPSDVSHSTINASPEPGSLSYEITTVAVPVPGMKPSAHLVINSINADKDKLKALELVLFGGDDEPRLPMPEEVIQILSGKTAEGLSAGQADASTHVETAAKTVAKSAN